MRGNAPISSIYAHGQPASDTDPLATYARIENLRRRAWRERGIISAHINELSEPLRSQMRDWMEANYGS